MQDFRKLSLTIKWAGSLSLKTGPVLWEGGRRKEEKTFELFHILKPGSFVGIAFMYLIKHSLAHQHGVNCMQTLPLGSELTGSWTLGKFGYMLSKSSGTGRGPHSLAL